MDQTAQKSEITLLRLRKLLMMHPVGCPEVAARLGVSPRTALNLLQRLHSDLVIVGSARRRKYALKRGLRGETRGIPVYCVSAEGRISDADPLTLVFDRGTLWNGRKLGYPISEETRDGLWPGLPYPMYDIHPQGFIGRALARRYSRILGVSPTPKEWNDDDILHFISNALPDGTGNLIVGEKSLELLQDEFHSPTAVVTEVDTPEHYVKSAQAAIEHGPHGSSAGGEFPKFSSLRSLSGSKTPHVLVKFSAEVNSVSTSARWADLLISEHVALETVVEMLSIPVARSRIIQHGGRTFLESERFDRHGRFGRMPCVSLRALTDHLLGLGAEDWRKHGTVLRDNGIISTEDAQSLQMAWWFGTLIGNTDMHLGNISLTISPAHEISIFPMLLAPLYDMLPMGYAPLSSGEFPPLNVPKIPLPLPEEAEIWRAASRAAIEFWMRVQKDVRITVDFRNLAKVYREKILSLAELI
jgi:hypothetical protein